MYRKFSLLLLIALALTSAVILSVSAQDITPREDDVIDPNANLSWPPPVYVLRGEVELRGSASLPNMSNYFIEFRPIVLPAPEVEGQATATPEAEADEAPWFPATLPSATPITEEVLGVWNTETAPDGLYEVRLVVNIRGEDPVYFYVSPLRIENEPPPFVVVDQPQTQPSAVPAQPTTLAPTPTVVDSTPRATANLNANVRSGDSQLYPVVANLPGNTIVTIVGISSTGSGWYQIQLPNGGLGWVAPSVVTVSGNLAGLPRIVPPPIPATPTPIATATPLATITPLAGADLQGDSFAPNPNPPTCNVPFQVFANLANRGALAAASGFNVTVRDIHIATGAVTATFDQRVDRLLIAGENFVVGGNLTVSTYYNEQHRLEVIIDTLGQVPETNESNNTISFVYTLQRGTC